MSGTSSASAETKREAKTWLFLVLAAVAIMMFVAGFVLVLT